MNRLKDWPNDAFTALRSLVEITSELKVGTVAGRQRCLDMWFENEHLLTNNQVFWFISGWAFTYYGLGVDKSTLGQGSHGKDWIKTWNRYGRNEEHFNKKFLWCNTHVKDGYKRVRQSKITGDYFNYGLPWIDTSDYGDAYSYFQNKGGSKYITVYRGFTVKNGEKVRKGVKRLNNKNALVQETGSGFSYSLSKTFASSFVGQYRNNYFLEKHLGIDSEKKRIQYFKKLDSQVEELWLKRRVEMDARFCLGTYRIKKRDIISVLLNNQNEVVVQPKNVELVRYDFLTWAETYGALQAHSILKYHFDVNNVFLRPTTFDENSLLSICRQWAEVIQEYGFERDTYLFELEKKITITQLFYVYLALFSLQLDKRRATLLMPDSIATLCPTRDVKKTLKKILGKLIEHTEGRDEKLEQMFRHVIDVYGR